MNSVPIKHGPCHLSSAHCFTNKFTPGNNRLTAWALSFCIVQIGLINSLSNRLLLQ